MKRPCALGRRALAAPGSIRLSLGLSLAVVVAVLSGPGPTARAQIGLRRQVDPNQVVPLAHISAHWRDTVAETIRDHTLYRRSPPDLFVCDARLYLNLLNEPMITLALWKDLAESPVRLHRVGPHQYVGTDDIGTHASGQFVYQSPNLHVMFGEVDHASPRGNLRLRARVVLIVRTEYFRNAEGESLIQHDVEAFVKVDSRGWRTVAKTTRPVVEKIMEEQVQEAGLFISLMGKLVQTYPNWACQVALNQTDIPMETRTRFRDLVLQIRHPDAYPGRPIVAENAATTAARR